MIDILTLLRRDHDDLARGLTALLDREASLADVRSALDGVRLGLTAHAEAEDIVFYAAIHGGPAADQLEPILSDAREAHLEQEAALAALVCAPLGTPAWRDRAIRLRDLVVFHATYEEMYILPRLRTLVPETYAKLAGKFASERLRQIGMLQPSAPVYISELARSAAL